MILHSWKWRHEIEYHLPFYCYGGKKIEVCRFKSLEMYYSITYSISMQIGDIKVIKMIITDLDNTLLRSDKSISDYTVSILKRYQDKGIKIAFATARSAQASSRLLERFAPDIFIGYGGAVSFAGDEVISRFDIPADISYQLINKCLQEPENSYVHAINESVAYTNRIDSTGTDSSHYTYVDFSLYRDISYLKISLVAANPRVVERIAADFPMLDLLRYTGEDLYRFADRKAVKWNAVKAVAEYYNIDTDMIVAFGDDINDYEMIKNCGIGVAVENAINEVKAVAKYTCDISDNDGVAKWLDEQLDSILHVRARSEVSRK